MIPIMMTMILTTGSGADYPLHEMPDMLCVQETKVTPEQVPAEMLLKDYPHRYWLPAKKDGYSGVGETELIFTSQFNVSSQDCSPRPSRCQ